MTTFYMDPVGGSDAADGLSFANRWKTLTNGATAARIAPGDTIRVIKSPDPVSLGDFTWTDNSAILTPATPKNLLVDDFNVAWTGVTNVTVTKGTTASILKAGPGYLNVTPATAFVTGKMAYITLGATLDLSAWQQLSFWLTWSSTAYNLELKLCSDTLGDVPLATLSIPSTMVGTSSVWSAVVLNNGAPLPAGINSIAFYALTDPSTSQLRCCNMVACKAPGADEVTHRTLLGKKTVGEPEWYGISEITNTEIFLGGGAAQLKSQDPVRPYRGVTETVTTYKRDCLPAWATAERTLNEGGTFDAPITLSGGWNSTDMSTQDGETWFTGWSYYGTLVTAAATVKFVHFKNFGLHQFVTGLGEANHGWEVDLRGIICGNNALSADTPSTWPTVSKIHVDQIWGCALPTFTALGHEIEFTCKRIHGFCDTAAGTSALNNPIPDTIGELPTWKIDKIDNNAGWGADTGYISMRLQGTVFENNLLGDIYAAGSAARKWIHLDGCTLGSTTKIGVTAAEAYVVKETNIGGNPRLHKTTFNGGTWYSTETDPHTAGKVNWVIAPTSADWYEAFPIQRELCKIAVEANKLVIVKCWIRRSNIGIQAGLGLDGLYPGTTKTVSYQGAAANTWAEVTLSFTPTRAGVVPILAIAFGGTAHTAEFADVTIAQAD